MEGRVLGRYRLLEEIGQGGMSVVYRGVDTTLDREVAVKILHPHLSRKESSRNRFAREAKAVARLHHDNILEIYDFSGDEARDAYIVTELVRGQTLAEFLEGEPELPVEVGVLIVAEIAAAVAHAHDLGVIHRDIKTENVMIRDDGVLKLMDFGIARLKEEVAATMTGLRMGTPHYMSPEQAAGTSRDIDERADVFALGVLLYRMTAGAYPFDGPNPAVILMRIIEGKYQSPSALNPGVGRSLERILSRALSTRADMRYRDAAAFREALQEVITEAGFGPPRSELRKYFSDPDAYCEALRERLVKRYRTLGNEALQTGTIPRALELFNRVLVLDPGDTEVKNTLRRLGRKRRFSVSLAVTAGVVFLAGVSAVSVRAWLDRQDVDPTPTEIAQISPTEPDLPPTSVAGVSATPEETPTPVVTATPTPRPTIQATRVQVSVLRTPTVATTPPTPTPPPGPAEGMGGFRLMMREMGTVYLDDKPYGDTFTFKAGGRFEELSPGIHQLRVEPARPECTPYTEEISITEGQIFEARRTFTGCVTYLVVRGTSGADLAGAQLFVDGDPAGIFTLNDDGQWQAGPVETHSGTRKLRVYKEGYAPFEKKYQIPTVSKNASPHAVLVPALKSRS